MTSITRRAFVLGCGVLLLACRGKEATQEAATISIADVAGTWNMRSVPETGDTTAVVEFQIQAAADGWTLLLPDRGPIVATGMASGDSIVTDAGPYESVRRPGLMNTVHVVYRLEGDRLVGHGVVHYQTSEPDSVLSIHIEGTRAP